MNLNIPENFDDFAEGMNDKQVMIEILVEDFSRYQSQSLSSIALFPTE